MRELVFLGLAGAAGSLCRYAVSGWAYRLFGERLAWGTLVVNVIGSFLLGLIMAVALAGDGIPRTVRVAVTVGFLGSFTTFSTYAYETTRYLEDGAWGLAVANMASNVVFGLLAAVAGLALGRAITGGA